MPISVHILVHSSATEPELPNVLKLILGNKGYAIFCATVIACGGLWLFCGCRIGFDPRDGALLSLRIDE